MPSLKEILPDCDCKYGSPMGRGNIGERPTDERIYDRRVPLNYGGYDRGGAYWGLSDNGNHLRVSFNKDLTYRHFYWTDKEWNENRRAKKCFLTDLPLLLGTAEFESTKTIIEKRLRSGK